MYKVQDFLNNNVALRNDTILQDLFLVELKKWDNSATLDTFYQIGLLMQVLDAVIKDNHYYG